MPDEAHLRRQAFAGLLVVCVALGCARQPPVYRVGVLSGLDFFAETIDGFRARMNELGYPEGRRVVYDIERTNFEPGREEAILKRFLANRVDVIVAFPTEPALLAKTVTRGNVPVVFAIASLEGVDLVQSLARPAANVTGVRYPTTAIAKQRFEVLRALVPKARRFWVPFQAGYPGIETQLRAVEPLAAAAGVALLEEPVEGLAGLFAAVRHAEGQPGAPFDAVLLLSEPVASSPAGYAAIARFAGARRIPTGGAQLAAGEVESIFGVSVDLLAVGRQVAPLVDKILRGTPAGAVPVSSAEPTLMLNLAAIRRLGLNPPEGLLRQATRIIP